MEFDTLKQFFNNELTIQIMVNKPIENHYIRINSILKNEIVYFSDLEYKGYDPPLFTGRVSENDAIKLSNVIDKSKEYFAKIIMSTNNEIYVSFVYFNKMPLQAEIKIGIGDVGKDYDEIIDDLNNNYFFTIGKDSYYIYGKHVNADDDVFSIVSTIKKYDVVLVRREECGAVYDKGLSNEKIWAIRKKSSNYRINDYIFGVRKNNFVFDDASSVAAATEQNKLEMKNYDVNSILGRWEDFAKTEFELSKNIIDDLGLLEYSSFTHEEDNKYVFHINNISELALFKNGLSKFNEDVKLEIFPLEDDSNYNNYICVEEPQFVGSDIVCFYDGNRTFPEKGYMSVSNAGSEVVYKRRISAINRIKTNNAAKPNIMQLIDGKPLYNANTKKRFNVNKFNKEIKLAFDGKMPDPSQLDAIDIAINTPDFAIIQGPPGCGKTSLINAIDDCLAKIDSGEHKKAGSLSTAYQRLSTKNMIRSKCINGVPVPFVSNSRDKIYIESDFMNYISNIATKLVNKYPDIVNNINKKTKSDLLTMHISGFHQDTATYDMLLSFIEKILECLKGTTFYQEMQELIDIQTVVSKKLKNILAPNKSESIYYVRIIPSSVISYEDDGYKTFIHAKINLQINEPQFEKYLNAIEQEYNSDSVNFDKIKLLKNEMIFKIKNRKLLNVDTKLNQQVIDIVYKIKDKMYIESTYDNESLLIEYIDSFINNPVRIRQALEPWITSIAATHQISSDNYAIGQDIEDQNNNVTYNNVLVDEAARSCPPDLLIPISCAKNRIIMVGDQEQLPQFINDDVLKIMNINDNTKKEMKNVSIFEYLIGTTKKLERNDHFKRFIILNKQYRMPKVLGDFIGDNFYPGINLGSPRGNPCDDESFIQTMPYIKNKCMVWCDVNNGLENKVNNKGWENTEEAKIVSKLVIDFLKDKENSNLDIGVISFYKDQVNKIIEQLEKNNIYVGNNDAKDKKSNKNYIDRLKVDTVDAFQGSQCDIVILSMVRSNPARKLDPKSFGFLRDERHLCVALSRQKRCLIVVGNGSAMLETDIAQTSVKALANYYKKCKEGGDYIGFIKSDDIL